jgi:hypothetical protein
MIDDEEENEHLDEGKNANGEEEDEMYSPSDDEDIDHDDTMSKDDPLGLHPNDGVEKETLDISSGEDKAHYCRKAYQ